MLQRFRASLEEADVIKDRNLALDFIGKRGSIENAGRVSSTYLVVCLERSFFDDDDDDDDGVHDDAHIDSAPTTTGQTYPIRQAHLTKGNVASCGHGGKL